MVRTMPARVRRQLPGRVTRVKGSEEEDTPVGGGREHGDLVERAFSYFTAFHKSSHLGRTGQYGGNSHS